MNDLRELGTRLAGLQTLRGELLVDRTGLKQRLSEIELDVLQGGVEGKNEEIRKLTRANMLLANSEWRDTDESLRNTETMLIAIEAQIAHFSELRRAEEWLIRAALAGLPLFSDEPLSDGVFEDRAIEKRIPSHDTEFDEGLSRFFDGAYDPA
jgi:hypothetical protein